MNRLKLAAQLIERAALRYTPAGLPVLEAVLKHEGSAIEAGGERQIKFEATAVAMGAVAEQLNRQALGSVLEIEGFLAARTHRRGPRSPLRIHVTQFQLLNKPQDDSASGLTTN